MKARLVALATVFLAAHALPADPVPRPKAILVIRHAEKPDDENDTHLSEAGKKRAAALAGLFKKSPDRPDPFPTPDFIFATEASKRSDRPVETVTPLAKSLMLEVHHKYANDEHEKLAAKLLSDPK